MKNNKLMMIKKKLGVLAAAVTMASTANAFFDEGAAILYAWNSDNNDSYFVDLGVTGQDLVDAVPVTVHDPGLGTWLTVHSNSQWSVISTINDTYQVANTNNLPFLFTLSLSFINSGIVGTSATGSAVGSAGPQNEQQKTTLNDWISEIKAASYGSSSFAVLGTDPASADVPRNYSGLNDSIIAIGSSASLFYVQADPTPGAFLHNSVLTSQVGTAGTPSQSAAYLSADGTFTVNVKAVPIPAAAWMFGSALVGLALARRK